MAFMLFVGLKIKKKASVPFSIAPSYLVLFGTGTMVPTIFKPLDLFWWTTPIFFNYRKTCYFLFKIEAILRNLQLGIYFM